MCNHFTHYTLTHCEYEILVKCSFNVQNVSRQSPTSPFVELVFFLLSQGSARPPFCALRPLTAHFALFVTYVKHSQHMVFKSEMSLRPTNRSWREGAAAFVCQNPASVVLTVNAKKSRGDFSLRNGLFLGSKPSSDRRRLKRTVC